jgi:ribose transport system substrate-binding protein
MRTNLIHRRLQINTICCVVLLAFSAVTFSSCKQAPATIAVIPRATAMPLWEAEHAGAQHAAAANGMDIYWNAPTSQTDVEGQIQLVQRIIEQRYKGLVLAPDQPLALMTMVRRSVASNIPTVIVGSELSIAPGDHLSYIVNDDAAAGRMAAARIAQLLGGNGSIAIVGIDPDSPSALNILHAFESALEINSPQITIKERRAGAYMWTESSQITDEILAAEPKLNAIFSLTSAATNGAHRSISDHGRIATVNLIGFQQTPQLMSLVRSGQIDSLIAENTYEMGYLAIQQLAAHAHGATMGTLTQLPPTLLTAQNVNSPGVQQLVNMNWSDAN